MCLDCLDLNLHKRGMSPCLHHNSGFAESHKRTLRITQYPSQSHRPDHPTGILAFLLHQAQIDILSSNMQTQISFEHMEAVQLGSLVKNRSNPISSNFDCHPILNTKKEIIPPKAQTDVERYYACIHDKNVGLKLNQLLNFGGNQANIRVVRVRTRQENVTKLTQPSTILHRIVSQAAGEQARNHDGPGTLKYFIDNARSDADSDLYLVTGITSVLDAKVEEYSVDFKAFKFSGSIPVSQIILAASGVPVPGLNPEFSAGARQGVVKAGSGSYPGESIFLVHYQKIKFVSKPRSARRDGNGNGIEARLADDIPTLMPSLVRDPGMDDDESGYGLVLEDGEEEEIVLELEAHSAE
jgi:hypothetical protein